MNPQTLIPLIQEEYGSIEALRQIEQDARDNAFHKAFHIGRLLVIAKYRGKKTGEIPHGSWKKWRTDNLIEPLKLSPTRLDEYMLLGKHKVFLRQKIEEEKHGAPCFCPSINDALKWIRAKNQAEREAQYKQELTEKVAQQRGEAEEAEQQRMEERDDAGEQSLRRRPVLGIDPSKLAGVGETEKRLLISDVVLAMLEDKEFHWPENDTRDRPDFDPRFYNLLKRLGEGLRPRQRTGKPDLKVVPSKAA